MRPTAASAAISAGRTIAPGSRTVVAGPQIFAPAPDVLPRLGLGLHEHGLPDAILAGLLDHDDGIGAPWDHRCR